MKPTPLGSSILLFSVYVAFSIGGCSSMITDPNRSIRDIGDSDKISKWALTQDDYGKKMGALNVLLDNATDEHATQDNVEIAIQGYLTVLNAIEDMPPDKAVKFTPAFSETSTVTISEFISLAFNHAAFRASERLVGAGVFLRIKPGSQHSNWQKAWQEQLDLLQATWKKRA